MGSVQGIGARYKGLLAFLSFVFIFLPQWIDSVWDLAEKIKGEAIIVSHPSFVWLYWVTVPVGVLMFGMVIWAVKGSKASKTEQENNQQPQSIDQLKRQTDALISQIDQFVSDRTLGHPTMPVEHDRASQDDWFQKSRQYDDVTNNLFVHRFQQDLMDIGYLYREQGLLTGDEWKHYVWITHSEYPVAQWIVKALTELRTKLR